jgi:hypothetical protein
VVLFVLVGALVQWLADWPQALVLGFLLGVLVAPWVPQPKDPGGCG